MEISLATAIIGGLLAIVGSLLFFNLRGIKSWLQKTDERVRTTEGNIKDVQVAARDCKVDCDRTFVNKELFLRETGFQRRSLENLTSSVSRLEGKLTVVEQLPKICGDISREIVKEMKNGTNGGPT